MKLFVRVTSIDISNDRTRGQSVMLRLVGLDGNESTIVTADPTFVAWAFGVMQSSTSQDVALTLALEER